LWGGWHWFKGVIGDSLGYLSYALLSLSGYDMVHYKRVITIEGARGIYIADSYLGITPMVIFSGLVLLYGNNRKDKWWFILLGIVAIFIVNVFRVTTLALIQYHYNSAFNPVHEYLYMAVTYGFVFLMVIWWLNKWADKKSTQVV
jgi:exosortase/archaeosortase family protein